MCRDCRDHLAGALLLNDLTQAIAYRTALALIDDHIGLKQFFEVALEGTNSYLLTE
jgi:hypothetical protein